MPPMITTTSELRSQFESTPGARLANEPPMTPPRPASAEPTKNAIANVQLDVDAERAHHRAIVDARADHHPRPRPLQPEPERRADHEREQQDQEARPRVLDPRHAEVDEVSILPGQAMSSAIPPKCESI